MWELVYSRHDTDQTDTADAIMARSHGPKLAIIRICMTEVYSHQSVEEFPWTTLQAAEQRIKNILGSLAKAVLQSRVIVCRLP